MPQTALVNFDARYLPDFVVLNRQWIETHFVFEEMDRYQLENPRESILEPGGEIFFLLENDRVVGTFAMVPHGESSYEVAKMAVLPEARGRGYGDVLMEKALAWAREKGASKVTLLSNTLLEPAISLYKKHGFKTVRLGNHPDYERCNIEMEIEFNPDQGRGDTGA